MMEYSAHSSAGHLVLHNLRLKKGLLEKLPILVQLIHGMHPFPSIFEVT